MRRIRRSSWFVAAGAAIALICIVFYLGALDMSYVYRPREPVPENGWVVPYAVKGVTVYLAPRELGVIAWLSRAGYGFAVIVILGGMIGGFGPKPPS